MLEAEIEMRAPRRMLLDDEAIAALAGLRFAPGSGVLAKSRLALYSASRSRLCPRAMV